MEAIDNLIRLGYEFQIDVGGINCSCTDKNQPDESAVTPLWAEMTENAAAALKYIKAIVRLDFLVIKEEADRDRLTVAAYDAYGNKVPELSTDMTGTEDEVGALMWTNYLESPMLGFIHLYVKGERVIAYMSCVLIDASADIELARRCPWQPQAVSWTQEAVIC